MRAEQGPSHGPHRVEPATPGDAAGIAGVHVAAWRSAYAGLMPAAFLAGLDVEAVTARWTSVLAAEHRTWVGRDEAGTVVGWASVGPARDEDPPTALELWALNVHPLAHGSGVAQQLVATALGSAPAYLWVLAGNARASAFYAKIGFALDGVERDDVGGGSVLRELRMTRG